MRAALAAGAVATRAVLVSPPAHAQPESPAPGPRLAPPQTAHRFIVSLPLFALSSNALAIQGERPVARRISAVAAVGLRDGGDGDYQSTTVALGGEMRLWLRPRQRGWFAGPRLEIAVLHMSARASGDLPARSLGTTALITEGVVGGYRFVLFDRVEITPTLGLVVRHDLPSGPLPGDLRLVGIYGITVGWLFD